MTETTWLIIAGIVIIVLIAAAAFVTMRNRNTQRLKSRFGSEYDRAVEDKGDPRAAESELHEREKRVKTYELKELTPEDRASFTDRWGQIQSDFVDDPGAALGRADALVGEVMTARGYPTADFDQRSADVSVDHPSVMHSYRQAHEIAVRHERGEAGTEELRQAMVSYRALFGELVGAAADIKPLTTGDKIPEPANETDGSKEMKT